VTRRRAGYLLALGSAATGAVRFNLAVFAKGQGFDYAWFLAGSLIVGILCCAVHVSIRDGLKGFVPLRGRWHHAILYGVLMGWGTLAHFLALEHLNETVMSSLSQSGLIITILLAVLWLKERFTKQELAATVVIFAGLLLVQPWASGDWKGMLILFSGIASAAVASIGAKIWVAGTPPRVLMLWRNLVALAIVAIYAGVTRGRPQPITAAAATACIVAGILGPYLHGLFFLQALERIEASKASLMGRVAPAIVFVVSLVFLGRSPTLAEIASSAVLVAGTLWLARSRPSP